MPSESNLGEANREQRTENREQMKVASKRVQRKSLLAEREQLGRSQQSTKERARKLTLLIFCCARCKNSSELGFHSLTRIKLTSLIFGGVRCKNSSELGFHSLARKFSLAGEGVAAT